MENKNKLFIVTTSVKTLEYILRDQPAYLNRYYDVYVLSNDFISLKKYALKLNLNYYYIPMMRKISPISDIRSIVYLIKTLLKHPPNIIHSYTPKAGLVCAISGYICRIPIRIHTFTGLIFPYKKPFMQFILAAIDSIICKLTKHVIAEGLGVKKLLFDNNITNNKIHIIGNGNIAGVDTQYFNRLRVRSKKVVHQLRKKFKIENGTRTFVYAGRLNKEKGIIELLESFLKLNKKKY